MKKKIKSAHKLYVEKLDRLWIKLVKLRAEYKCELSDVGNEHNIIIASHHVFGKSCYALRFDLRNGICLQNQTLHINGIHSNDPLKVKQIQKRIEKRLIEREGEGIIEKLELLRNIKNVDLKVVEIYLKEEEKKIRKILNEKKLTLG